MNESLHIQTRLRTLLQRFYDGTSTPEEEREIGRLLHSPECASDKFAEDRVLFEALAAMDAQATPPPALGEALEEKTARHFRQPGSRAVILLRWGIAAAVAACMAGIVLMWPPHRNGISSADGPQLTAKAEQTVQEVNTTEETVLRPEETTVVAAVPAPRPQHRVVRPTARKAAANPIPSTDNQADDIDLDDGTDTHLTPEQAARVSEAALMTLARTLASADDIYRQTDERIEAAVTTTFSRLQSDPQEPENKI